MELPHYPNTYAGKNGFEIFLRKHIIKHNLSDGVRKELLLKKRDLQDNYVNFCYVHGYPVASFICIGRHLTFLGITINAHIGPQRHQCPIYCDLLLSREAHDLVANEARIAREDPDSSRSSDQDFTDCTLSSNQDTESDANSELSVSYDDADSLKEEDSLSTAEEDGAGGQDRTLHTHTLSEHYASWDITGYTSWDTGCYTQQDKAAVFEYVNFLEDFVASFQQMIST